MTIQERSKMDKGNLHRLWFSLFVLGAAIGFVGLFLLSKEQNKLYLAKHLALTGWLIETAFGIFAYVWK